MKLLEKKHLEMAQGSVPVDFCVSNQSYEGIGLGRFMPGGREVPWTLMRLRKLE